MGLCKLFGMCSDDLALHDVDVAVSLVGLEDNQSLVYMGTVDPKTGEIDGSIVQMDNEEIYAYEGPNMINPGQFTDFDIAEEQAYALDEARNFSIGQFSVFDIVPWPLDPSQEVDADFVKEAFAGEYDVVRSFENVVQELADERSEVYEQLRMSGIDPEAQFNPDNERHVDNAEIFGQRSYAEGKLAEAEAILDRLERADNLEAMRADIEQQIEADDRITPEQKEVLKEEVSLGTMDGPGATDPAQTFDIREP